MSPISAPALERLHTYVKLLLIDSTVLFKTQLLAFFLYQSEESEHWRQLVDVVDFALALKDKLEKINKECFNQFVLRVGEYSRPVSNTGEVLSRLMFKSLFY